ncbi:MAG TPA: hypothetical protein VFR47_33730 [Anaerolineales bacterium]|nr:hypothetical protein [Anaerolineales bacterium]
MITSIIFLIPFLTIALVPLALKTISSDDPDETGICLENLDTTPSSYAIQGSDHILPKVTVVCGKP